MSKMQDVKCFELCLMSLEYPQKAEVRVMRRVSVLPALAMSIGLFTVSQPAHAEQRVTVSGAQYPYCAWETWVLSQSGNGIQVTAYAWGQGWNGGACDGAPAPEYSVSMDASLAFKETPNGPITHGKTLTPSANQLAGVWNTTDGLGIYFATIPGAGLLSSGAAGLVIPSSELWGPGYYQIEMDACVPNPESAYPWICGPVHSEWQYMNIPNP
jgi:hypothetical protein